MPNDTRVKTIHHLHVLIQRVGPVEVPWPRYQTEGSAGMDLQAALQKPVLLQPGKRVRVPTGIALALPHGFEGQVRPRSGLAANHGVTLLNSPGTIDSDFRGMIEVLLIHLGETPFSIAPLERIAQLVVTPFFQVEWIPTECLPSTSRGVGGYGSTGLH
ncbi:deoxyuridine 5'-triphosphate nucleotidohydrolase [Pajaroellobacter abortibovis]|uniref:Deoxyuridine 5'-triphosphate nucleotidohydrolase n=2 Tax=Pajaroellobacter abortibovis TaxID=1882918 RepID=A0A1L6MXH4_9BACT|nr:deoxyuridine 5'-triphosphate nucleotidohydrolase [Pajaroellobacter abortibovis]